MTNPNRRCNNVLSSLGWLLSTLWFAALTLAACSSSGAPTVTTLPATQSIDVVPTEPTVSLFLAPAQPSVLSPTELPATAQVIDNEFHPSDPASVSLAIGRPQFVEFFAFW